MKKLSSYQHLFIYLFVIVLAFSSCTKKSSNEIPQVVVDKPLVYEPPYYWTVVENCITENNNNNYDNSGIQHNLAMEAIQNAFTNDMDTSDIFYISDSILVAEYGSYLGENYTCKPLAQEVLSAIENDDLDGLINDLDISLLQKTELNNLIEIMSEYDVSNYAIIIGDIKYFEDSLIEIHSDEDIMIILQASAIARYSMAYWHDMLTDETKSDNAKAKKIWKKIFIGVMDAIGGGVAAATTSLTGPGCIAAGIAGGVGTSAAAATVWKVMAEK